AEAVNELGDIVGMSQTGAGTYHATLWAVDGAILDLDTLGSAASIALALNDHGQIVGHRQAVLGDLQAFVWTAATGMQALPLFPGDTDNEAVGISAEGVIVGNGSSMGPGLVAHGILWRQGNPVDLQTLIDAPGWVLQYVAAMNPAGAIVGLGKIDGQPHGFRLIPTPDDPPAAPDPVPRVARHRHPRHRHLSSLA